MLVVGLLFALGYLAIAFERPLGVNKAASALLVGVTNWTAVAIGRDQGPVVASLHHHPGEVSGVVFFVLGAMVVVELIDAHLGFEFITSQITTRSRRTLPVPVQVDSLQTDSGKMLVKGRLYVAPGASAAVPNPTGPPTPSPTPPPGPPRPSPAPSGTTAPWPSDTRW